MTSKSNLCHSISRCSHITPAPATRWFPFCVLRHQFPWGFPSGELGRENDVSKKPKHVEGPILQHYAGEPVSQPNRLYFSAYDERRRRPDARSAD
jgi:hypothetical protein